LGAFVLRRSSKTWFDNVFQVDYVNRYLRTQNYEHEARSGRSLNQTKVKLITKLYEGWCTAEAVRREASSR
jgi:carotenoid cleavage dioxygenase-like enzyme